MPATLHLCIKKDYALFAIEDLQKMNAVELVPIQNEQQFDELHQQWLKQEFEKYKEIWKLDTMFVSSTTQVINHPAYLHVIALGEDVVPLLLKDMELTGNHGFYALYKITNEDPIPDEHAGKIQQMVNDWLDWAHGKNIVY